VPAVPTTDTTTRELPRLDLALPGALRSEAPPRPPWRVLAALTAVSVLALVAVVLLGDVMNQPLLIPPLAASIGLIASVPDLPLAQPRNVIGGHLVCCLVGALTAVVLGHGILVAAVAGGLAVGATLTLRMAHSPAAATAVIVAAAPTPIWTFTPLLLLATTLLVLVGVVDARIRGRAYPAYWW
jgi:CBS-domain-containing membrane protein